MSNRQKIYIGLAVSAGVCTGIGLFLYFRHRRQVALSKAPKDNNASVKPGSLFSSIKPRRGNQYNEITSPSPEDESESVRFQSGGATVEVEIPGGGGPLSPDQAIILTRFLDENNIDIARLHRVLTNIANAATYNENQINLANAGCIARLREMLSTSTNEATQCKIILALNNLALNETTITHFSDTVSVLINLCRTSPPKSQVRLFGLNLLINMSVLEYLHAEFMQNIYELGSLVESTFDSNEEILSAGKILVNLSTNKSNLEYLLKLTGVDLKTIVTLCTPSRKHIDANEITKLEDVLLRYLTFYCNISDMVVNELREKKNANLWLTDPIPYRQGAVYFELFDHEKQMASKLILRPQYLSSTINGQVKRLRQAMDNIRQIQFDSSVSLIHNEFDDYDQPTTITDSSTPKKTSTATTVEDDGNSLVNLAKDVNDEFNDDDDDTILPGSATPSNQSLASFRSALSTTENNTFTSPDNSVSS